MIWSPTFSFHNKILWVDDCVCFRMKVEHGNLWGLDNFEASCKSYLHLAFKAPKLKTTKATFSLLIFSCFFGVSYSSTIPVIVKGQKPRQALATSSPQLGCSWVAPPIFWHSQRRLSERWPQHRPRQQLPLAPRLWSASDPACTSSEITRAVLWEIQHLLGIRTNLWHISAQGQVQSCSVAAKAWGLHTIS